MAPAATDSPAPASLDDVVKPPTGLVLPPKDIRTIVEKTAGYVARNGPAFEERIRQKELNNPKFSFLGASDAYNPFYAWRLSEVRAGRGTAVSAGRDGAAAAATAAAEEEQQQAATGPPEPPEFHFSARMPNISAQDLEVVKLTALFLAKHGRSFVTALAQRETGNYQFDFLRPQHSLNGFFTRLVDQYVELLTGAAVDGGKPERARRAQLAHNKRERLHVLERARQRAEWVRFQQQQKQRQEQEAEEEKVAYAQVDWHDFVVVESVLFTDADDHVDLPAPTSLNDLQSASLEQKAMMSLAPHGMRIEEAMPTADDEPLFHAPQQQQQSQQQPPSYAVQMPPPPHAGPYRPSSADYPMQNATDPEGERAIREREDARERARQVQAAAKGGAATGAPMRIRNDYVPRAQAKRRNVAMALCPNCKQQIPYDELEAHMRIELLDPRWKEEKQKADSRFATTNLSTADVANNLKRLASQRSDVFDATTAAAAAAGGGAPAPQQQLSEEEEGRRKKQATQVFYDGQADPKDSGRLQQMQNMNIEEQIRQIHQKFKN